MKILYICPGDTPDYQCDLIFIGLRNLLGTDIVDLNKIEYLYKEYDKPRNLLYGKGFTYTNTLDILEIDRSDIENKIKARYYDKIIYGSIHRNNQYLAPVLTHYNSKDIIFIDGEDLADDYNHRDVIEPVLGRGLYFKRENTRQDGRILPIQFCIPACKVISNTVKTKTLASIVPGETRTYTFDTEEDYYGEYMKSVFAITTKKCGWDCLRHYEILGNGCIPIFGLLHGKEENALEKCPIHTMHLFPKSIVQQMTYVYNNNVAMPRDFFLDMANILLKYTHDYLTCEAYCKNYMMPLIMSNP